MTFNEKRQLVRLLNIYQDELIGLNEDNKQEIKNIVSQGKPKWEADLKNGIKAQYTHARILSNKLEGEINNEISSYWNL